MRNQRWSEEASAHLAAFRAEVEVEVDVDSAWSRFEADVAPRRRSRPLAVWVGGVATLAAAVAVAWLLLPSHRVGTSTDAAGAQARDEAIAPPSDTAVQARPAPRVGQARSGVEATARPSEPVVSAPPGPHAHDETQGDAGPGRRRPRREAVDATPQTHASHLAEELRLLEGMRRASTAARHAEALEVVRAHQAAFGRSPFAAERELTRVRALCGLGRLEAAKKAQASFARTYPRSHLGSLVRGACNGSADDSPMPLDDGSDHDG